MTEKNLNQFLKEQKSLTRVIQFSLHQKVNCLFLCPTEYSIAVAIETHCTDLASNIPVALLWKD